MAHARRRSSPAASVNSPSGAFHGTSNVGVPALRGVCTAAGAGVSSPLLCAVGSNAFASLSAFPSLGSPYSPAAACSSSGGGGRRPLVLRTKPPRQDYTSGAAPPPVSEGHLLKELASPSNENSIGAAAVPQPALTSLVTQISKLPSPLLVPEDGAGGCCLPLSSAQTPSRKGRLYSLAPLSTEDAIVASTLHERKAPRRAATSATAATAALLRECGGVKTQQTAKLEEAVSALLGGMRVAASPSESRLLRGAPFSTAATAQQQQQQQLPHQPRQEAAAGSRGAPQRRRLRVTKTSRRTAAACSAAQFQEEPAEATAAGGGVQGRVGITAGSFASPSWKAAESKGLLTNNATGPALRAKRARRAAPLALSSNSPVGGETSKRRKAALEARTASVAAAAASGGRGDKGRNQFSAMVDSSLCLPDNFWECSFEVLPESSLGASTSSEEEESTSRNRDPRPRSRLPDRGPLSSSKAAATAVCSGKNNNIHNDEFVQTALFPLEWLGRNGRVSRKHGFLRGWEGALRSENLLSQDEGVFILHAPSLLTRSGGGGLSGEAAFSTSPALLLPRQRIALRSVSGGAAKRAALCVCNCSASTASTATRSSSAGSPSSCSSDKAFCAGCVAVGASPLTAVSRLPSVEKVALETRPLVLEKPAFLLLWRYSERPCPQDRCMRWFSITTRLEPVKYFGRAFESQHGVALVTRLKALLSDRLGDVCPRTQAVVRAWGLAGCLEAALFELGVTAFQVNEVKQGPFKGFPEPTISEDDVVLDSVLRRVTEEFDSRAIPHPRWQAPAPAQKGERISNIRNIQRLQQQSGDAAATHQLLLGEWHETRGGRPPPFALVTQ